MFASGGNFVEWQTRSRTLEGFAAIQDTRLNLTAGPNGHVEPEELKAERVSAGLFPLLGVQPVVGRAFRLEEDQPGHTASVLLSYPLWQRRFGADSAIAGKSVRLRDQSFTVLGVLPAGFAVLEPGVDVWVPLGFNPADPRSNGRNLVVVARMAPATTLESARREMAAIGDRLEAEKPALDRGWRPTLLPIMTELAGEVRQPLLVLLAAVALLLLIACANVANLLLARGAARRKEVAIRTALGAGRVRIALQMLSESVLLGMMGGLLGLGLARGAITLLARWGPASVPRLASARLDPRALLFAVAVSVLTGILFGIAPAWQISGGNLNAALVEGTRGGTPSRSARFLRNALVVGEVSLALVLLIGAGLLVRSYVRLRSTSPGFEPSHRLTFRLPMAGTRNSSPARRIAFLRQVEERMALLPGVHGVGAVTNLPLTGLGYGATFTIDGRPAPPPEQRPVFLARAVTPGYFRAAGVPLLEGRPFSEADTGQAPAVALVNQKLAQRFWPDTTCLGGRVIVDYAGIHAADIVGVVGNTKPENVEKDDWPTIFFPYEQLPVMAMTVILDTARPPLALAQAATREIHQLDPDQPVTEVRTLEEIASRAMARPRFNTTILAVFGGLSFLLAAVGIYGVISYDVTERTHELGIRAALGAQKRDLRRLVLGHTARLAACGIALGLAAAWLFTRLMSSMLFQVSPRDFYTYASISLILGMVALAASYFPSRRAMALDPLAALRHE